MLFTIYPGITCTSCTETMTDKVLGFQTPVAVVLDLFISFQDKTIVWQTSQFPK